MRRSAVAAAVLAVALGSSACGGQGSSAPDQPTAGSTPTAGASTPAGPSPTSGTPGTGRVPRVGATVDVTTGLQVPWGLAFVADGSALVAERPTGRVVRIGPDGGTTDAGVVPGVRPLGEGGRLGAPATVLTGIPAAGNHNGGRIVVGPDGNLWIGTGDAGDPGESQDRTGLGGKILRVRPDGSVPADNPFPGSPVWSYGHRNVQGLAFDSTGQLWATEFGQNTWDELNKVTKGGNHGWPDVEGRGGREGFVDPQVVWRTGEASPSGLAIVDDVAYVAALRGRRLWQVPIAGGTAGQPVAALDGDLGRLRTVEVAPEGAGLWVTTSNTDGRGSAQDGDDRVVRVPLG